MHMTSKSPTVMPHELDFSCLTKWKLVSYPCLRCRFYSACNRPPLFRPSLDSTFSLNVPSVCGFLYSCLLRRMCHLAPAAFRCTYMSIYFVFLRQSHILCTVRIAVRLEVQAKTYQGSRLRGTPDKVEDGWCLEHMWGIWTAWRVAQIVYFHWDVPVKPTFVVHLLWGVRCEMWGMMEEGSKWNLCICYAVAWVWLWAVPACQLRQMILVLVWSWYSLFSLVNHTLSLHLYSGTSNLHLMSNFRPLGVLDGFDRSSGGVVVKISRGEDTLEESPGISNASRDDDETAADGNDGEV